MSADELDQDAAGHGAPGAPRLRPQDPRRPRRARSPERRGQRAAAARLDRGDRHPAGRGRAAAPEGDADRQRARHPAAGHDRAHPRRRAARSPRCAARRTRPASTPTPASTSSSPRAARAAATAARSARSCCGRRWSRRSRPVPVLAAGGIGSGAADRRGAGARRAGRVDRLAVADGRGGREHPGPAGRLRQGHAAATPCAAGRSPASRAACCATTGPRRGRTRTTRSRSACRCSTWCPAWPSPPPTSTPTRRVDVAFNPVGQVVGQFNKVEKTAAVIERWVQEYLEATEHAQRAQRGGLRLIRGSADVRLIRGSAACF